MLTCMEKKQYRCPKYGGNFAKIFDAQSKRFITIPCTRCGYTELFKQKGQKEWDIFDFFLN
ncbi:MAG: DNA-binding protein [Spirochaetaceae bacterium]|nr:DNA-binding protein [Spirochaetaceae bacterium]